MEQELSTNLSGLYGESPCNNHLFIIVIMTDIHCNKAYALRCGRRSQSLLNDCFRQKEFSTCLEKRQNLKDSNDIKPSKLNQCVLLSFKARRQLSINYLETVQVQLCLQVNRSDHGLIERPSP